MVTNNIEIEAKVLLSEDDYKKALKDLHLGGRKVTQTNYYLDSHDRILKKYGMILRIRVVNNNTVLTMKAPMSEGLLEKTQSLSYEEADSIIHHDNFPEGEIADFLDILHIPTGNLFVLAKVTTEREESAYKGTRIDLSKNRYSGITDYELECDSESAHKSQETLRELCEMLDIPFVLNTVSKETRAINQALGHIE